MNFYEPVQAGRVLENDFLSQDLSRTMGLPPYHKVHSIERESFNQRFLTARPYLTELLNMRTVTFAYASVTIEEKAQLLGCSLDSIGKTVVFEDETGLLYFGIVPGGDRRVDELKFKAGGLSRSQAKRLKFAMHYPEGMINGACNPFLAQSDSHMIASIVFDPRVANSVEYFDFPLIGGPLSPLELSIQLPGKLAFSTLSSVPEFREKVFIN